MSRAELSYLATRIVEVSRLDGCPPIAMSFQTAYDFFLNVHQYNDSLNLECQTCIDPFGIEIFFDNSLERGEIKLVFQLNAKEQNNGKA